MDIERLSRRTSSYLEDVMFESGGKRRRNEALFLPLPSRDSCTTERMGMTTLRRAPSAPEISNTHGTRTRGCFFQHRIPPLDTCSGLNSVSTLYTLSCYSSSCSVCSHVSCALFCVHFFFSEANPLLLSMSCTSHRMPYRLTTYFFPLLRLCS